MSWCGYNGASVHSCSVSRELEDNYRFVMVGTLVLTVLRISVRRSGQIDVLPLAMVEICQTFLSFELMIQSGLSASHAEDSTAMSRVGAVAVKDLFASSLATCTGALELLWLCVNNDMRAAFI